MLVWPLYARRAAHQYLSLAVCCARLLLSQRFVDVNLCLGWSLGRLARLMILEFDATFFRRGQWYWHVLSSLALLGHLHIIEALIFLIKRLFQWYLLWTDLSGAPLSFVLRDRTDLWMHRLGIDFINGTILLHKWGSQMRSFRSIEEVVLELLEDVLSCLFSSVDLFHFLPDLFYRKVYEVFSCPSLAVVAKLLDALWSNWAANAGFIFGWSNAL